MIIKQENKGNVTIYHVEKDFTDAVMNSKLNKHLKRTDIDTIIDSNADVYTEDGKLLLRFRKNKLSDSNINLFYDNVIDFAKLKTCNRGDATGKKRKTLSGLKVQRIMTNIIGYFDKLSAKQKFKIQKTHKQLPKITVRETRFVTDYPQQYKQIIPLIKEIDALYKQFVPDYYAKQKRKANQTPFHIANTSFTTITTNVNFQTTMHTDRGDDSEGFGNLAVIERENILVVKHVFPNMELALMYVMATFYSWTFINHTQICLLNWWIKMLFGYLLYVI